MIASRLGHREPGLALGLYFLPEAGMVPWPWVALKQRRRRPAERSPIGPAFAAGRTSRVAVEGVGSLPAAEAIEGPFPMDVTRQTIA